MVKIHWEKFRWKMPPTRLLTAALCQHRHKQDGSHNWECTRSSTLKIISPVERNIVRWNRKLHWNVQLLQTNLKFEFNCIEYEIWKIPSFSVLICWNFEYKHSLMPNDPEGMMLRDPAVFQPFHCVSNVALHGRAKTVAAVIVHTKIQFFKSSILNLK